MNEDASIKLELPTPPEDVVIHSIVAIGLVAIQNEHDKKWCATHETRGWYMPAGRVDYGEGLDTGAKREALEEAGVNVNLTHVVRVDFSPNPRFESRLRVIYKAQLADENETLRDKSKEDEEIIEACWVDPKELEDGRQVRTTEMTEIFQHLNRFGADALPPASFIQSVDGNPIKHDVVRSETMFSLTVILIDAKRKNILVETHDNQTRLISKFMETATTYTRFVTQFDFFNEERTAIVGYVGLRYAPPHDQFESRKAGHLNAVMVVEAQDLKEISLGPNQKIVSIDSVKLSPVENAFVQQTLTKVYPVGVIDLEGMPLVDLGNVQPGAQKETQKTCCIQ